MNLTNEVNLNVITETYPRKKWFDNKATIIKIIFFLFSRVCQQHLVIADTSDVGAPGPGAGAPGPMGQPGGTSHSLFMRRHGAQVPRGSAGHHGPHVIFAQGCGDPSCSCIAGECWLCIFVQSYGTIIFSIMSFYIGIAFIIFCSSNWEKKGEGSLKQSK
jgi:hypothetical protein